MTDGLIKLAKTLSILGAVFSLEALATGLVIMYATIIGSYAAVLWFDGWDRYDRDRDRDRYDR